jgi:hypothetical protein
MVIELVQVLQSVLTDAFVHSRVKMPLPGAVSMHTASVGSPKSASSSAGRSYTLEHPDHPWPSHACLPVRALAEHKDTGTRTCVSTECGTQGLAGGHTRGMRAMFARVGRAQGHTHDMREYIHGGTHRAWLMQGAANDSCCTQTENVPVEIC